MLERCKPSKLMDSYPKQKCSICSSRFELAWAADASAKETKAMPCAKLVLKPNLS